MKSVALITLATVTLAVAAPAMADDHRGKRATFEEMDTNKDGQLSKAELEAQGAVRFAKLDANKDGALSVDEMVARAPDEKKERAKKRAEKMIKRHDQNGDGMLQQSEVPQRGVDRIMKRLDKDGDGSVSKAEFEAMKDKRKGKRKEKSHG